MRRPRRRRFFNTNQEGRYITTLVYMIGSHWAHSTALAFGGHTFGPRRPHQKRMTFGFLFGHLKRRWKLTHLAYPATFCDLYYFAASSRTRETKHGPFCHVRMTGVGKDLGKHRHSSNNSGLGRTHIYNYLQISDGSGWAIMAANMLPKGSWELQYPRFALDLNINLVE